MLFIGCEKKTIMFTILCRHTISDWQSSKTWLYVE